MVTMTELLSSVSIGTFPAKTLHYSMIMTLQKKTNMALESNAIPLD